MIFIPRRTLLSGYKTILRMQIYVHIPFCKSKCAYCDFNSYACRDKALISSYLNTLIKEIDLAGKQYGGVRADTVYIGGGTPSMLDEGEISRLFDALEKNFCASGAKEVTIECNPESVTREKLALYRSLGINRLSVGVQSFCDDNLKIIGRLHSSALAEGVLKLAREYFDNLSCDLIIGLPFDTQSGVAEEVGRACGLVDHLSMYELSVEKGTRLERMIASGKVKLPDDDKTQALFDVAYDVAKECGFERYEVSNFAKNGKISLHNFGYWTREEYLGFGAGAHSFVKTSDGKTPLEYQTRYANSCGLKEYMNALDSASDYRGIQRSEREYLSKKDVKNERIMLGLRTTRGVESSLLGKIDERITPFFESENGYTRLTRRGMAVMNSLLCEVLDD